MSEAPTTRRSRLAAGAALLGAATALTLVVGVGPAPSVFQLAGANEDISGNCDEAEHANDPECTGSATPGATSDDSSTSTHRQRRQHQHHQRHGGARADEPHR